jgi:hypothetical protein
MPPIEGGQSLGLGTANPQERSVFSGGFCKLRLTKGLQKVVIMVDRFTEGMTTVGLKEQWGLEAVTKSLHDPFEDRPKAFNKVVVRPMTQPEKEPENFERPARAPAKPTLIERRTGRPSSTGKPWEAEGISRQAWYKREKKSKGEV